MGATTVIVVGWAFLFALSSVGLLGAAIVLGRRCPQLGDRHAPDPASWPTLSVVVPARDEADSIGPALASLCAQDYPRLELVVVDDRSTDGTGAIAARAAAADARLTVVLVHDLPAGWLGKVHALQRGLDRTHGEWILFTDADVHFAPGALRRAIAWAEAERFDHLAVLAEVRFPSFWAGLCVGATFRSLLALARPWEATDPRSPRAIGNGAFNLVRRAAFERTPGFEWLRLEVADDLGLGLMMKRSGGRPGLAIGRGQVRCDAYASFGAAARGLEKNAFAQAARFSPWRGFALVALAVIGAVGPIAAFLPVGIPWLWTVGVIGWGAVGLSALMAARALRMPIWVPILSLPLGDLLLAYVVARATVLALRRGGLTWRGTTYPTAALRSGCRVRM